MKVLDVILTAVKILGDDNLYYYISDDSSELSQCETDRELLLIAYNQAITSACAYFPFSYSESFSPVNGRVSYENFTYNPYKILSVTPKNACSNFKILPTEILVDSDIAVEYNYFLDRQDYTNDFAYGNSVVSALTISYGVLSEYLLYKGRYDESITYNDKFINALKNSANFKKKSKIKAREWY